MVILSSTGVGEGFANYAFVPAWRRPFRGGWRRRWWPYGGWGRYGWGNRWGWDPRVEYVTYMEPFVGSGPGSDGAPEPIVKDRSNEVLEFLPNEPAPTVAQGREPYHLLKDERPSVGPPDEISCVNSRSCYATDFGRLLERSSYRQMTNNFRHANPESCTAPFQELITNFYKDNGMTIDVKTNCL